MKKSVQLALLAASCMGLPVAGFAQDNATASEIPTLDMSYEKFVLDNGLTVLVHSDHSVPTVFVGLWYGVGSKDEPTGKTGFAHLFEHLMFKGSEHHDGSFMTTLIAAGATDFNGTTSTDRTNYYQMVPSGALDTVLWMESDRMTYLLGAITEEKLVEEREVVKNELRDRINQPYGKVPERISAGLYPVGHPYRHPVIGSMEDLANASIEDVKGWFRKYYGATNVVLVLAGDILAEDAKEKAVRYFSAAPPGQPLAKMERWLPVLNGKKIEEMYDHAPQPVVSRNWVIPTNGERDTTLLQLASATLAESENSPLRKVLVDDLQLAQSLYSYASGNELSGVFNITVMARPGASIEQISNVIDEQVAAFLNDGPSSQAVANAKLSRAMGSISSMEHKGNIAGTLAEGQLYHGDPAFIEKQMEWIDAANASSVQAAARRWLTDNYYQINVRPFPTLAAGPELADRSVQPAIVDSGSLSLPDPVESRLSNGARLFVISTQSLPLVDVRIDFDTGSKDDPDGALGIASAVFNMMSRGTASRSASELAEAMETNGSQVSAVAGRDSSTISFQALSSNLPMALDIAQDMIISPAFPTDELEKRKLDWRTAVSASESDPAANAALLLERAIFGAGSRRGRISKAEDVDAISRDGIVDFYNRQLSPDKMTVYVIGDVDVDEATAQIERTLGSWQARSTPNPRRADTDTVQRPRIILVNQPGAVQTTIHVGHALSPFTRENEDYYGLINRVFGGGLDARVNMNLRHDKGWSYGIGSKLKKAVDEHQLFSVSGTVQMDKTAPAMTELLSEFRAMAGERPIDELELRRARESTIRSLPARYSANSALLRSWANLRQLGLPFDHDERMRERIGSITTDELNTVAAEMIEPESLSWVIIGDLSKIEPDIRALDMGEIEVWDSYGERVR
ncbi:insulinase family protein [Pacificimonas sp. WHA3]|uniref:Insulinase family protein n=1 Tax=Pacificimonas pallii TaxID=2827236 RepID=A0ABS6SFF2_9SPHN|nr:pitrilysin family protein [Pacificimonas pallii]MBV7256980.1 insulinase family protein [Pacificimonas pallii]